MQAKDSGQKLQEMAARIREMREQGRVRLDYHSKLPQ